MHPLRWLLKDLWSPMSDNLSLLVLLSLECTEAVCCWLQEERLVSGIPLHVSPPSLLLHRCLTFGRGGVPSTRSDSVGSLVSEGEPHAYQCSRDASGSAGVDRFSPPVLQADCCPHEQ